MDRSVRIVLDGKTELLMHNPLGSMGKPRSGIKRIPPPGAEAAAACYFLKPAPAKFFATADAHEAGDLVQAHPLGVPGRCIRASFVQGASPFRITAKQYAKRVIGAAVRIDVELVPLTREGKPIANYIVDWRRAVVEGKGIMRARPLITPPWQLDFVLTIDDEMFASPQVAYDLLQQVIPYAGKFCGLLDNRPGSPKSPGPYGRFTLTTFEEQAP